MPTDIQLTGILSYSEWISKNISIPHENRLEGYDNYLKNHLIDEVVIADEEQYNKLRDMYLSFMTRIATIYKDDDDIINLNNVDMNNKDELIASIPIIASKIRDIAFYYNHKRTTILNERADVSLKGSSRGFITKVRNLFMTKYSENGTYQDPTIDSGEVLLGISPREELVKGLDIRTIDLYNISSQTPKLEKK